MSRAAATCKIVSLGLFLHGSPISRVCCCPQLQILFFPHCVEIKRAWNCGGEKNCVKCCVLPLIIYPPPLLKKCIIYWNGGIEDEMKQLDAD